MKPELANGSLEFTALKYSYAKKDCIGENDKWGQHKLRSATDCMKALGRKEDAYVGTTNTIKDTSHIAG
jgi:hypothetical protein